MSVCVFLYMHVCMYMCLDLIKVNVLWILEYIF